ncbi:MAG: POTRA domain-containing protein [Rikenellaceae bacterium]
MSRLQNIWLLFVALVVSSTNLLAQEQSGGEVAPTEDTPTEEVDLYLNALILDSEEAKRYRIRDVRVHGVESNAQIIAIAAGAVVGDSINLPGSFTSSVIENLWAQRRFSDVKMGAVLDGDDVEIDLYLTESPRVFRWDIEGVRNGQRTSLLKDLNLRRNSELSDYALDKSIAQIKKYYIDKGYLNVDVDTRVVTDSLRSYMVDVTFVVDLKNKVKIGEVVFEGNEAFEDKRLGRALKKTREKKLTNLFKSSNFNRDDYKEDLVELLDFYNSKGYRNAMVVSDSIYNINDKRIGIKINVSEGNKYYIRNVSWVGNSKYDTEYLQKIFAVEKGDIYDRKAMNKRLGMGKDANPNDMSILTLYQNEGYLMSQIDPAEVIIGRDSIDLEIKIFEGNPFTVNNVIISGNERVDDEVIRRELYTRPGELYNRSLLMQTIQALGTIGHFNPESIMPSIQPVTNELVDIGWPLEEQASDQFNVSGGWGSGTFVASVGITLNNLSVKNIIAGDRWAPYPMGQNQRLAISAQTNGTYYKSFSLSFTDPWLGGRRQNSFTVSAFYSDQNNANYTWQESTAYFRTLGVSVGLGKRLTFPDPYFTLYGELSYQRYMLEDWSNFLMTDGSANLLSATVVLSRSSVDQPTYPRRGTNFSASLQITPPYSLVDGKNYGYDDDDESYIDDDERYKFIEFHKWQLKMDWYQSFLKNSNLVLKLSAEMGYLGCYDPDKVSPFERFEVGGDGMSGYTSYGVDVISLRGYEDGALNPTAYDYAVGYNKYSVELRYPVLLEPSSQIYLLAFAEAGNGFESWKYFSPFNIKRSAGVGVRVYLPIVGTLGLDWGYGFDAPNTSTTRSGSQFHFVIGQQF